MLFYIIRFLPIGILTLGATLLLIKKRFNTVFWGILGLLALEILSHFIGIKKIYESIWTLYLSGPIYLVLIHYMYDKLFFKLFNTFIYRIIISIILLVAVIGLLYIHPKNPNIVFYYIVGVELIILTFPIIYFLKLVNQTIKYKLQYFLLNSVILLFFSLEIIFYVMFKFLFDYEILKNVNIGYYRFIFIQLFYISLIYFGCKLQKS